MIGIQHGCPQSQKTTQNRGVSWWYGCGVRRGQIPAVSTAVSFRSTCKESSLSEFARPHTGRD